MITFNYNSSSVLGLIELWIGHFEAKQVGEITCGIDDAIGANGPVRRPDIPSAIGCGDETGHRGRAVDLGTVHPSTSGESHGERVGIDVSITGSVETC